MEYSRAKAKLPPELSGLSTSQVTHAISEANLGLADRHIAMRCYIDQLAQIDVAVEMGFTNRSTVSKRLKNIAPKVVSAARNFNIPQ